MTGTSDCHTCQFEAKALPGESMFPRTRYFEVDSVYAGVRYAVWITTPKSYDREPERAFPVIYSPDGNSNAPLCAGASDLGDLDFMDSFEPTIQISVGYTDEDSGRAYAVRARDLLPPNEPLPAAIEERMRNSLEEPDGNNLLDRAGMELYLHNLQNPAGERFLAFLTEELHPFVTANYRIDADRIGLFGHSYGGLFSTYASLQPSTIFRNFGASSPGIAPGESEVFKSYQQAALMGELSERNLHMTIATREITVPGQYQDIVGVGTVQFINLAGSTPIRGFNLTSQFFEDETHITVKPVAFYNFLRAFYLRRPEPMDDGVNGGN